MSDSAAQNIGSDQQAAASVPVLKLHSTNRRIDLATILGAIFAVGLIIAAIAMGQSDANFFNVPALMIVLFGTMAATAISYTGAELARAGHVIANTIFRPVYNPSKLAENLLDIAVVARKHGILAISQYDNELKKNPELRRILQMVIDGYQPDDIEKMLTLEIAAMIERHKRSASITRRASEVAPAMGLIGTLVGLVQMLADLENPETIGPAMAVALLTTFYGAILGTVIMAPLSVKLEKNSHDDALIRTLIATAAVSIARQENPRRLEMLLNSELSPTEQIDYFKDAV
ncbi:MAG: biopolymer transporter ExbB [Micavibrio sp.]|nr:biopolymer transporter ExbB [Micavibrio sp.]|tara:strand:- start:1336 stop:2202 length:867 start_codon:yes stop_codon:yes gene_type:complete